MGKGRIPLKRLVLTLALAALASPALAVSRYDASAYTCDAVQAIVQKEGQAVFRYPSLRTGFGLYELLVRDTTVCGNYQTLKSMTIPTKNTRRCHVTACQWGNDRRP